MALSRFGHNCGGERLWSKASHTCSPLNFVPLITFSYFINIKLINMKMTGGRCTCLLMVTCNAPSHPSFLPSSLPLLFPHPSRSAREGQGNQGETFTGVFASSIHPIYTFPYPVSAAQVPLATSLVPSVKTGGVEVPQEAAKAKQGLMSHQWSQYRWDRLHMVSRCKICTLTLTHKNRCH